MPSDQLRIALVIVVFAHGIGHVLFLGPVVGLGAGPARPVTLGPDRCSG